jgi:hypothetical protein
LKVLMNAWLRGTNDSPAPIALYGVDAPLTGEFLMYAPHAAPQALHKKIAQRAGGMHRDASLCATTRCRPLPRGVQALSGHPRASQGAIYA